MEVVCDYYLFFGYYVLDNDLVDFWCIYTVELFESREFLSLLMSGIQMASNVVLSVVAADPAPLANFFYACSYLHFNIYENNNYDQT